MSGFDLRFVPPLIINLLKFQSEVPIPWEWDPFNVLKPNVQASWTQICFHVFLLLLFSFTSITFFLTPPSALIRFRFGDFSPHMVLSLLCSLFFPQTLFWFLYPAILIFNRFLGWVHVKLCGAILPVWNIHIISTLAHEYDHEEANIHIDIDSQVPVSPQVSVDISPQGDSSLAEG